MNIIIVTLVILAAVLLGYAIYIMMYGGKRVYAYVFENIDNKMVLMNPLKAYKARLKMQGGMVEELHLPIQITKKPLPGVLPDDYIMNKQGHRLVYLLKEGESEFRILKPNLNVDDNIDFDIIDRDVQLWAESQHMINTEKHKVLNSWDTIKQIIVIGIIGMVLLMGIVSITKSHESTIKDITEVLKDVVDVSEINQGQSNEILNSIGAISETYDRISGKNTIKEDEKPPANQD